MAKKQPAPEYEEVLALIERVPYLTAGSAGWCCEKLRAVCGWVRQIRTGSSDLEEIQQEIAEYVEEDLVRLSSPGRDTLDGESRLSLFDDDDDDPFREIRKESAADLARTILNLCRELARYREAVVEEAITSWRQHLVHRTHSKDELAMLEKQLCDVFHKLDDRTRFLFDAYHLLGGREYIESFSDIEGWFDQDLRFLRQKSREYANDPVLGCVARAVELVEAIENAEAAGSGLDDNRKME